MGFLAWIILGACVGALGSFFLNRCHEGFWADIWIGTTASVLGASTAELLGWRGVDVFNWRNVLVGVVTAVVAVAIYNAYRRRHPGDEVGLT